MNEVNQNRGPASSCWCWPFQCSERKLRASADPNLTGKNADLWMLSMMANVIIDYDHCSQLRDMVGPRDKLTRSNQYTYKSVQKSV